MAWPEMKYTVLMNMNMVFINGLAVPEKTEDNYS